MEKNQKHKYDNPYAYFITFTTYGNWLHCDDRYSVDRTHNVYGTPRVQPNKMCFEIMRDKLAYDPFIMNTPQRKSVLQTVIDVCEYCHWRLFAVNVRTNHLHIVVQSDKEPEFVMTKIKAYASRNLNILNPDNKNKKYWTRHGSTKPVRAKENLYFLMNYVVNEQGANVACYYEKWFDEFLVRGVIPENVVLK